MTLALHQIVTFSGTAFSGNPGWVLSAATLPPVATLSRVAEQLREPVLAALATGNGGVDVRFVTPQGEHPGAGHAAHAAAFVAFQVLGTQEGSALMHLPDGRNLPIQCQGPQIAVTWPRMPREAVDRRSDFAAALGAEPQETFQTPFGPLAVFATADEVAAIRPDSARILAVTHEALTVTAPGPGPLADFVIRVFAPRVGLLEDPVCGTAHRFVAPFWSEVTGKQLLVSHQISPRGGELQCAVGPDSVRLGGRAVVFASGHIAAELG